MKSEYWWFVQNPDLAQVGQSAQVPFGPFFWYTFGSVVQSSHATLTFFAFFFFDFFFFSDLGDAAAAAALTTASTATFLNAFVSAFSLSRSFSALSAEIAFFLAVL